MAFVLEEVSDEQRREVGFAVTMKEIEWAHVKFVSQWAIDRERDARIVSMGIGPDGACNPELHWQGKVILIKSAALYGKYVPADMRSRGEEKMRNEVRNANEEKIGGEQYIAKFFRIFEMVIPYEIKDKLEEIKLLVKEGMDVYGSGDAISPKYYGRGYTEFDPNMKLYFSKLIRSQVKPEDVKARQAEVSQNQNYPKIN